MRHTTIAFVLLFAGCSSNSGSDGANPDPRCQPITPAGTVGSCFLPFPSSYYLKSDATSATGYRVSIPTGILPKNQIGNDYDVTRLNWLDGFSPAAPIVVELPHTSAAGRVDRTKLPAYPDGFPTSLIAQSTVQLFEYASGNRVPLFAEVDANSDADPRQAQVLLIHPAMRLQPATRYVVALQNLVDTTGAPIVVTPFRALVEGTVAANSPLLSVQSRYSEILALLDKQGLSRAALTLAWDFVTASDKQGYGDVLSMRDTALARWAKDDLGYTITDKEEPNDPHLYRSLIGTFHVPSFLTDNTDLYAGLKLDAEHHPVDTGTNYDAKLIISIPQCALKATKPLPILIFGHGFFGSATQILTDQQKWTADTLCMVEVATDWVGMAAPDMDTVVAKVFADFDTFWIPSERLRQGVLNAVVLARFAKVKMKDMPELQVNGKPIVDGNELYYFGISQGGILGGSLLALSPDLQRGALNVGAGAYSLMSTRSGDFTPFKQILDFTYPAQRDQEILLALMQGYFDYAEPIGMATHWFLDPFPDESGKPMAPKQALLQEAKNDAQVPNVATRVLARTAGLRQLDPPNEAVFGIDGADGPLDSAYTQWDVGAMPASTGNIPPANDNGAHDAIGKLPALMDQLARLFRPDGRIEQTCNGPCVFAMPK